MPRRSSPRPIPNRNPKKRRGKRNVAERSFAAQVGRTLLWMFFAAGIVAGYYVGQAFFGGHMLILGGR